MVTSQKRIMTKLKIKNWEKNAQIMESEFEKPQNWEISLSLTNLKVLGTICDEI